LSDAIAARSAELGEELNVSPASVERETDAPAVVVADV
jgi:hypothetical protein